MTPTPHINADIGDFAKTVIMPGDPLRSKFIAENFLKNAKLVNNVRGVQGYTGEYEGVPVSVMASGMGMPSIAIYSYELFNFFGVENIIRVGSCGAMQKHIAVRDIVIAQGASTNSAFASQFGANGMIAPICSYTLMRDAVEMCEKLGARYHVGSVLSSDIFYNDSESANEPFMKMGVLAVEMEAAALYLNAMRAGKNALAVCTVSDHIITGEATSAKERETSFTTMMEVALSIAAKNK